MADIDTCICWITSRQDAYEQIEELGEDAKGCAIVMNDIDLLDAGVRRDYKKPYIFILYGVDEELMNNLGWFV